MAGLSAAQVTSKVTLDNNETLFSVLTAINACGYDQELAASEPLRMAIRAEVTQKVQHSQSAAGALERVCEFYKDHEQADGARTLAQYVSLALNVGEPPSFTPLVKEADLPPDAGYVLGLVSPLQSFYITVDLHDIWKAHRADYDGMIERLHEPVAKMIEATDFYLRMPISGYVGRKFTVLVEPMGAPGQTNARNYANDYYVVISPRGTSLKMEQIRHTYLHFVLDPLMAKRASSFKRMEPILLAVKTAPMDESFKNDASLLVEESLIRAIEARTMGKGPGDDPARNKAVEDDQAQGFVLTRYFYGELVRFEKEPIGLKDALPDWLYNLDVDKEAKRAANLVFATQAAPEVVRASKPRTLSILDVAEQHLNSGDIEGARKIAQQALDEKRDDPGRALFILAKAASLNKDMPGAKSYFEQALQFAREPRLVAWVHVYLGRIFDIQENREAAVEHYRAALAAGPIPPDAKAAAERGLAQPYEPQRPKGEDKDR